MTGHHPFAGRGGDELGGAAGRPAGSRPWRVLLGLVPIVLVVTSIAGVVGYDYGRSAGAARVADELRPRTQGARTPPPSPTSLAPEPFISSMPRPKETKLESGAPPVSLVGPAFDASGRTTTLSPNVPFSFRAPRGSWEVRTPRPQQDIAFATAFRAPTDTETPATAPLSVVFAWRACGECGQEDVAAFDARFREQHDTPEFDMRRESADTAYAEVTRDGHYHLVVRHVFEAEDGRTYLVDFSTRAPVDRRERAQQLANEILTQTS